MLLRCCVAAAAVAAVWHTVWHTAAAAAAARETRAGQAEAGGRGYAVCLPTVDGSPYHPTVVGW